MLFSHETERALARVVELVNTDTTDDTLLEDPADLQSFIGTHDSSEVGAESRTDLAAVRRLQERFRAAFTATSDTEAAALVNDLLGASPVTPRLSVHDGYAWRLRLLTPAAQLAERLAVDGALALADVIARGERDRLRTCEADGCDQVLVDLSRNRSRRYCDARTCGNRTHVAAYRRRRAELG